MKWIIGYFLLNLLLFPLNAGAKSFYSDGTVDNSSGTPNKDLVYSDFEITQDSYVTGYIINKSNRPLKSVRLDMWTTNRAETAILWRKALNIGDMAPNGKYEVKEPYGPLPDAPSAVVFKFRLPGNTNFRNSGQEIKHRSCDTHFKRELTRRIIVTALVPIITVD